MSVNNICHIEIKNCIVDELHVRKRTDNDIDLTQNKENWQIDTYLLAKFLNNLEAGNIDLSGVTIEKFAIKRRNAGELNSVFLGYVNYIPETTFEFNDYTQPNTDLIYTITPIATGDIEGKPDSVEIESDFVGYFIVDKDTNNILEFDKIIGNNVAMVDKILNQGRVQIETFSKYPSIYYTDQEYTSFSLTSVFLPEEWKRSGIMYENMLNKFIRQHKPFIIKGSNGSIYVADISNPRISTIMNETKDFNYIEVTIDCVEIQDYKEFIEGG